MKHQRRFGQTTSAFIGYFEKPTESRLCNGSQFCACYPSKTQRTAAARVYMRVLWTSGIAICMFPAWLSLCEYQASRKKKSRENNEPCLQLSHGRSLYYGKTGSRVAQFWSYYLQPELPVYVLLTLFPRLGQSVHNTRSCNQRNRPCKQHLGTAKQKVCPLVSRNACVNKYIF